MSVLLSKLSSALTHICGLAICIGIAYLIRIPVRAAEGTLTLSAAYSLLSMFLFMAGGGLATWLSHRKKKRGLEQYSLFILGLGWVQLLILLTLNLMKGTEFQPLVAGHGAMAYLALFALYEIARNIVEHLKPRARARISNPSLERLLDMTREQIREAQTAHGTIAEE